MINRLIRFTSMASVLLVFNLAEAKATDSDSVCFDSDKSKDVCRVFIQGFLQGALLRPFFCL